MASITRTKEFSDGQSVNRQDIADLLENALVSSLGTSDLESNVTMITAQSEAPTAAPGIWWWDMTEQLMKVYDGAHSLWLAIGPDRKDIPMQNWSGADVGRGVAGAYTHGAADETEFRIGNPSSNQLACGSWAETTLSGAWGPFSYVGIIWVWDDGSPSGGVVNPNDYIHSAAGFTAVDGRWGKPAQATPVSGSSAVAIQSATAGEAYLAWFRGHVNNTDA